MKHLSKTKFWAKLAFALSLTITVLATNLSAAAMWFGAGGGGYAGGGYNNYDNFYVKPPQPPAYVPPLFPDPLQQNMQKAQDMAAHGARYSARKEQEDPATAEAARQAEVDRKTEALLNGSRTFSQTPSRTARQS